MDCSGCAREVARRGPAGIPCAELGATGVASVAGCGLAAGVAEEGLKAVARTGLGDLASRMPPVVDTPAAAVTVPASTTTAFLKLISSMRA